MNQLYWCPTCKHYVTKKIYASMGGGTEWACSVCGSYLEHKKQEQKESEDNYEKNKKAFLQSQRSRKGVLEISSEPPKDISIGTNWCLDICDEFLKIGHQNLITNSELKEALDECK